MMLPTMFSRCALLGALFTLPLAAQVKPKPAVESTAVNAQERELLALAQEFAAECTRVLEGWISAKALSKDKLFSRLYYAVPGTDPAKYTTDYDALSDKDISPIQERFLARNPALVFLILTDLNGYVPSHNLRYAQPLTGNRGVDLVNNRTKRMFLDRTGFAAARNTAPYLVQRYQRDTGEQMADLSVPVMVQGQHWGCVRLGYKAVN